MIKLTQVLNIIKWIKNLVGKLIHDMIANVKATLTGKY